ncbi:MAG: response regulator [Solirubrobacteraceae bacterium]|nr:response regulator [Solirubrobacteraceae bacterium]
MVPPRDTVPAGEAPANVETPTNAPTLVFDRAGQAAIDAAPFSILVLDAALGIVATNRVASQRIARPRETVIGAHVATLMSPPLWLRLEPLYRRALAGEEVHEREVLISKASDSKVERRSFCLVPIVEEAQVVGVAGAFTDSPMREHAELQLRVLTDLYAMLSRASRAAAVSATPQELYQRVCEIAVETGHFRCAWVGVPDGEELTPVTTAGDDRGYFEELFVSLADGDPRADGPIGLATRSAEMQVVDDFIGHSAGQPWQARAERSGLRACAAIPFTCGGEVAATLTVYAPDVDFFTEELVQALGELAPTVSLALDRFAAAEAHDRQERERERLEEQLRQSAKMEAIGTLAGGVAHDFNNTLTVIRNTCRLMLGEVEDPKLERRIRQIDDAAESAASLTSQLLTFGRRQVVRREVLPVDEVVQASMTMVRRMVRESISIATDFGAQGARIEIDRGDLQQVLLNLAANARDAMPSGGRLAVRTAVVHVDDARAAERLGLEPGSYAYVEASDTGVGMDRATLHRMFEPFFTTKEFGNGLGLATVFGVVRDAGGHVWAYSEPGLGTTMRLYFPLTAEPELPAAAVRERTPLRSGSETVLVVEDSEMLRPIVAEMLTQAGYRVLTAVDGVHALEVSDEHDGTIDLVLTDVVMPRMNGRELAEHLAAKRPGVRVIYTSGYPADTVVRHGIAEASVAFVQKPYVADELLAQVRIVLDEARA